MADLPPEVLDLLLSSPQYKALLQAGVPPDVARSIMTQPTTGEGETPPSDRWTAYRGWEQESKAGHTGPRRDQSYMDMVQNRLLNQQLNLPTQEGNTPGDDDNLGFLRLPNGQYVVPGPTPDRSLNYWRSQGNPDSFFWNPQPGSRYTPSSYSPGGSNMPWPNLTPQELAAYQQMLGGGPMAQPGGAQQMTPQMQAYLAMMAQQQQPQMGQMNPAMQQPSMANMLAARPNASGGMMNLPTTPGYAPSGGNNMSTILNNPHLMQLLMAQYPGGAST